MTVKGRGLMRKTVLVITLLLTLHGTPVGAHWEFHDVNEQYLFGYAGVEENLELYLSEIESNQIPTNAQTLVSASPVDDLRGRLEFMRSRGQRAFLVLDQLLFLNDPNLNTPCGAGSWRHRLNFQARFDNWLALNGSHIRPEYVAVLVVNTEINNRCISFNSLDQVTRYVKEKAPAIPTLAGYGRSTGARPLPDTIPASLAGVALFKYRTFDPQTDPAYQEDFSLLKSKLTPEQRIILVPDGFYDSGHAALGWAKWYLGYVALNYMRLAQTDPVVVGLIIFRWPSFDEGELKLGTRDLPQNVRDRHRQAACGLKISSPWAICN
jgi:hypothetical protein